MQIRFAQTPEDCASASAIFAESWKSAYRGIMSDKTLAAVRPDRWVERFNEMIQTQRFSIVVANGGQRDVGAGVYGRSREHADENWGEIVALYLLPDEWGKGTGKALMAFMLGELSRQGCARTHLWVVRENERARRFYEAGGFSLTGEEDCMNQQDKRIAIVEYAIGR